MVTVAGQTYPANADVFPAGSAENIMDKYQQLEKLAELKSRGALSEKEFATQKERVLATDFLAPSKNQTVQTVESGTQSVRQGTYWLPIPSLILGIISWLALLDNSAWDADTVNGLILFSVLGFTLGVISLSTQPKGRGMAIAGVVLGSVAGLLAFTLLAE